MPVSMEDLKTLAARANALGVGIRRGFSVEWIDFSEDGVSVGAGDRIFHGHWLVGCDGGRSTGRKTAGFAFVGTEPEFTGSSVEVELADAHLLSPGRHYTRAGMFTFTPPGTIAMVAFDGGAFRRNAPVTLDHVQAVLREISGINVVVKALRPGGTDPLRPFSRQFLVPRCRPAAVTTLTPLLALS